MKVLFRMVLTVVCFFAAIGCYVFGIPVGGLVFLALGMLLEGLFWCGVLGNKKAKKPC